MTKWYVTVDKYCSHCDEPDAHVWTVSRDPNDTGWETDSGYPGYGLTKHDAEELANAANRVEQLETALRHYACGCKENECEVKPRYAPLKCGWPARKALEGK
jgi:hypothetical protein